MLVKNSKDIKQKILFAMLIILLLVLLLLRVNSGKYSLDTAHTIDIMQHYLLTGELYSNIAGLHRFNLHYSPIYFFISDAVIFKPSVFIFFWKFICFGSFLICIHKIIFCNKKTDDTVKNTLFLLVLCNPTLVLGILDPNIWDVDLTLPFLGLSLLCLSRKKYFQSAFYVSLTYLIKEDMPLVGCIFGIMIVILSRQFRYFFFAAFSLLLFFIITQIIMPSYSNSGESLELLSQNFSHLGGSFNEIARNILYDPSLILTSGFWLRKFVSIFIMFGSVAFISVVQLSRSVYLLPAIPIFGYATIANEPFLDYSKHYMLVGIAFIIFSSTVKSDNLHHYKKYFNIAVMFNVIIIILHLFLRNWIFYFTPITNLEELKSVMATIDQQSTILTHGVGSPWIGHGRSFQITDDFSDADLHEMGIKYIVINKEVLFWEVLNDDQLAILTNNLRSLNALDEFFVIHNANNAVVLQKKKENEQVKNQINWTADLENFHKVNQVTGKSNFINLFREM